MILDPAAPDSSPWGIVGAVAFAVFLVVCTTVQILFYIRMFRKKRTDD